MQQEPKAQQQQQVVTLPALCGAQQKPQGRQAPEQAPVSASVRAANRGAEGVEGAARAGKTRFISDVLIAHSTSYHDEHGIGAYASVDLSQCELYRYPSGLSESHDGGSAEQAQRVTAESTASASE